MKMVAHDKYGIVIINELKVDASNGFHWYNIFDFRFMSKQGSALETMMRLNSATLEH